MSKTKQRKNQAYRDGFNDGSKVKPFSYKRQLYKAFYKKGFKEGQSVYKEKTQTPTINGYDDL